MRPFSSVLTGCILKRVKILHESALFLHKSLKNFLERKHNPLSKLNPLPFRPYSKFLDPPLVKMVLT